jgi:hypothetical protein
LFGGPLFAGCNRARAILQTDLHEKHENLNKNLNLPALSQLQFRPFLTSAFGRTSSGWKGIHFSRAAQECPG